MVKQFLLQSSLRFLRNYGCKSSIFYIKPRGFKNYSTKSATKELENGNNSTEDHNIKHLEQHNEATEAIKSSSPLKSLDDLVRESVGKNEQVLKVLIKPGTQATASNKSKLMVFHKPTGTMYDVDTTKAQNSVSVFFPHSGKIYDLDLPKELIEDIDKTLETEKSHSNPASNIESVVEHMWTEQKLDILKLPQHYLKLSKIRLTGLVVLTFMAGYTMAPGIFEPSALILGTLGTCLTSCSANAINQYFEVPFDSQMNRTKNRVLVRGILSPLHAVSFAAGSATLGLIALAVGTNSLTVGLGALNLILYTLIYTPMKRTSILNTWVGSIVGALPPIGGWVACTGTLDPGALLVGAILYAWQFPHFNALSWNLRPDYSRAGYRMMSVVDPKLCKRVAFRYCGGLIGLCTLAPLLDVTTWTFAVNSLPLNVYLSYLGWRFYRDGDSNSSRKLFRFSLIHLPTLMLLLLISKKSYKKKHSGKNVNVEPV